MPLFAYACMGFLALPPFAMASVKSASEVFLASSEIRLEALSAGFPARSAPWQAAHLPLQRAAPSSAAQDRLGTIMNKATAIATITSTSSHVFMNALPF